MICKKYLVIILTLFAFVSPSFALEKGAVEYDDNFVDYSVLNSSNIRKEADAYFQQYLNTQNDEYLGVAMGKYYILTKIYPAEIYPAVQLARIYDEKKIDRLAKEYFNKAYNIDKSDAFVNYSFGNFYYKRADYKRALRYFLRAYEAGYTKSYDINYKIATIYEKFADLMNALYYYKIALSLNPSNTELDKKCQELKQLNYQNSEYYK